jgi:NAD-dependent dihydropyrimidine dehydrogenase PreA subunit
MIELVSEARCIGCDICVKVCPTNVFDAGAGAAPSIARQEDCQTCFMCEAYCPTDALFVAPDADQAVRADEAELDQRGALGSYRAALGWGAGRKPTAQGDQSFRLIPLLSGPPGPPLRSSESAPK